MKPYFNDGDVEFYCGDALSVLRLLEDGECDSCVTSPPYLDSRPEYSSPTIDEFEMIFVQLKRVTGAGPFLLNVGRKWKDRREMRWYDELVDTIESVYAPLRDTRIWVKPNANPIQGELLTDSHEYVYCFAQDPDAFDVDALRTAYSEDTIARMGRRWLNGDGVKGGQRLREGRPVNPEGARGRSFFVCYVGEEKGLEHPAPMPLAVAEELVKLSGGKRIIDPFAGAGTTCLAARNLERQSVGIELLAKHAEMAERRLGQQRLNVGA